MLKTVPKSFSVNKYISTLKAGRDNKVHTAFNLTINFVATINRLPIAGIELNNMRYLAESNRIIPRIIKLSSYYQSLNMNSSIDDHFIRLLLADKKGRKRSDTVYS